MAHKVLDALLRGGASIEGSPNNHTSVSYFFFYFKEISKYT